MFSTISSYISNFIWSWLFFPGLIVCAGALTISCRGLQFRRFGLAMRLTVGSIRLRPADRKSGTVTPFQAAATALGSTVGTGNIVGVSQAIAMGGPGALFWLWAAALIGMIVKYAEVALAIYYRRGSIGSGPMDYITHGLGRPHLARVYGVLVTLSAFCMGNLVQVSSIADSFVRAVDACTVGPMQSPAALRFALGLVLAAVTALLLSGGAGRVGTAAEALVPLMSLLFIAASMAVVAVNHSRIIGVMSTVFIEAFRPGAITGGICGVTTAQCIQWGLRRSAFSNEAGLGTAAIAHAAADTDDPAAHGMWGIFEVFADTIVICTCTALAILCSGVNIPWGSVTGTEVYQSALASVFGARTSAVFMAVTICLFAYTSVMGWAVYGSRCAKYISGRRGAALYGFLFPCVCLCGCVMSTKGVWQIADLINALMSLPNLASLLMLAPVAGKISRKIDT